MRCVESGLAVCLAVGLSALPLADVSAQTAPTLQTQLTDLVNYLNNNPDPTKFDDANLTKIRTLRVGLEELLARHDGNTAETQSVLATTTILSNITETQFATRPQPLADAVHKLADPVDRLDAARDPVLAFGRVGGKTTSLLGPTPSVRLSDPSVRKTIDGLVDQLMTFENGDIVNKTTMLTTPLSAVLDADKTDKTLLNYTASATALAKLYKQLVPFAIADESRIHIAAALYGDRSTIAEVLMRASRGESPRAGSADRWCDATATLKASCERTRSCKGPPTFSSSLCGYDPAPFVKPVYKSAVVIYECAANNNQAFWDAAVTPTDADGTSLAYVTAGRQAISLWNENQAIYCAAPPPG